MKKTFLVIFLICFFGTVLADFDFGEPSYVVEKEYAASGTLMGWINLSLDDESTGILFEDNLGNSIQLRDLLEKNDLYKHNCTPKDCGIEYTTENPQEEKNFVLGSNESKILGAKIEGKISKISSFSFSLESNAGTSCESQIKIDILSDGEIDFQNNKISSEVCEDSKDYGCFSQDEESEEYTLSSTPYCQKIGLKNAPGYKAGAWIKKINNDPTQLRILLYDGTKKVSQCDLPKPSTEEEVSCDLDYPIYEEKDYYVCVFANNSGSYRIKGYSDLEGCAFYGIPSSQKTEISAYSIFASPKKFGAVGTFEITNKINDETNASKLIENYIKSKYGSLDCPSDGCVIPFTIESTTSQNVKVDVLELSYEKTSGEVTNENIYDVEQEFATVDAGFQKFYLDEGNFTLPSENKNFTYRLSLDGDEIFEEKLTIGGGIPVVKSLSPKTAALGFPTKFVVEIEGNATKFEWKFDSVSQTTTKNEAKYTFDSLGKHNITVSAKDSRNRGSVKIFEVNITTPEEKIESEIEKIQTRINGIKTNIITFDLFGQQSIKSALNLDENEAKLKDVQLEYEDANSDEDYVEIIKKILEIDVPSQIFVSETAEGIIFFPQEDKISLNIVESITGEEYNSTEKFGEAVLGWQQKNIEAKVNYEEITGVSEESSYHVVKIFKIEINQKTQDNKNFYIIIEKMNDLIFKENYGQRNITGHYYFPYRGEGNIVFSTTEDVGFVDLPLFFSPELVDLPKSVVEPDEEEGISKWIFFGLALIFLLIIAFIVYAILHQWYKNKYETHLFKNRNNLFNLVHYINNQKKKGVEEKEIVSKLKKTGWDSEQINYAIKKYCGKRTGMIELPFLNFFNKRDLTKQDANGFDTNQRGGIYPPRK